MLEKLRGNNDRTTPHNRSLLENNQIFVFGSNEHGRHGGGAAHTAVIKFGAIMGQGEGLQGQSYAIPTMEGIDSMRKAIPASRSRRCAWLVYVAFCSGINTTSGICG